MAPSTRNHGCAQTSNVVIGRGRRQGFVWSKQNILYAFDLWHRRYLRAPRLNEWRRAGADHPSHTTVFKKFGSWSDALEQAGLERTVRGGARPGERRGAAKGVSHASVRDCRQEQVALEATPDALT